MSTRMYDDQPEEAAVQSVPGPVSPDQPMFPRPERVSVGSGDEGVAKLQLAARWSELYAPETGDTIEEALRRFKKVYNYVDSVSKLVEPED